MTDAQSKLDEWRQRLDSAGLGGLADGLGYALRPLGLLAAQFLWFSQPAFGLFGRGELAESLAESLEALDESGQRGRDEAGL